MVTGPNIITDGLSFYIDAGNVKSYPGSGTVITDISNVSSNYNLVNGVGYSSNNGGSLVFDGVNDRLSPVSSDTLSLFDVDFTLFVVISVPNPQYNQYGSYFGGVIGLHSETGYYRESAIIVGHNEGDTDYYIAAQNIDSAGSNSSTISFGRFEYSSQPILLTLAKIGTAYATFVNGQFIQYIPNMTTYTRPTSGLNVEIGWVNNQPDYGFFRGNIHYVSMYNRVFSLDELASHYNSFKNRFL